MNLEMINLALLKVKSFYTKEFCFGIGLSYTDMKVVKRSKLVRRKILS